MGGSLILMHKFTPARAASLLLSEECTMTGGVPNMVSAMLDELDRRPGAWDKVRLESLSYGGGPPSSSLPEEARQRAPRASASQGYGLTGASFRLYCAVRGTDNVPRARQQKPTRWRPLLRAKTTSLVSHILPTFRQAQPDRPTPALAGPTSCGLAALAVRIKIIPPTHDGPASSAPSLAPGETGEICVHGPNVALGYWRDEEATRKAFDDEGWFRSCVFFFPSGPACMSPPVDQACRFAEVTLATSTKKASSTFPTARKTSFVPSVHLAPPTLTDKSHCPPPDHPLGREHLVGLGRGRAPAAPGRARVRRRARPVPAAR